MPERNATMVLLMWCAAGCGTDDNTRPPAESEPEDDSTPPFETIDHDGDGVSPPDDCNDDDALVHPGAAETCDGVDQDCDDAIDEDAVDMGEWHVDTDGDGWGAAEIGAVACIAPSGLVASGDDCDDADPTVQPGAPEICDDGRDNDCIAGGAESRRATGSGSTFDYFIAWVASDGFRAADAFYDNDLAAGADVNGDGRSEILVGMPLFPDLGYTKQSGAVLVIDGSVDAFGTTFRDRITVITGEPPDDHVGTSVVGVGDLDADGYGDVAVGDTAADAGTVPGRIGIFHGPITGEISFTDADLMLEHDRVTTMLGSDISPLSTDEGTQIVVGAPWDYFVGIERYGGVYVLDPNGDGTSVVSTAENVAVYRGEEHLGNPGVVVHDLGDTNGDGVSDIGAECAPCYDTYDVLYVLLGPHDGDQNLADADTRYLHAAAFGPMGDTDGDGLADVAARGALSIDVYRGPPDAGTVDMSKVPGVAHLEEDVFPLWTSDLTGADVDGDRLSDLAIPNPYDSDVYLFYGPVSGTRDLYTADLKLSGDYGAFGWEIESLGDVDDDGHEDLLGSDWDMNLFVMLGEGI